MSMSIIPPPIDITNFHPRQVALTAIVGGFAFVMALSWNNFIQSVINKHISQGDTVKAQAIYAISVTVFCIVALYVIIKLHLFVANKRFSFL